MIDGLLTWSFFTVIFAFLPLLWERFSGRTNSWGDLWGSGEVVLIAAAFGAESLGESLLILRNSGNIPTIVVGANFIVVVCAIICYQDFADKKKKKDFLIPPQALACSLLFTSLAFAMISKSFSL